MDAKVEEMCRITDFVDFMQLSSFIFHFPCIWQSVESSDVDICRPRTYI